VGINASDINYTAGRYRPGVKPPFDAGFESAGVVVAVGEDVKRIKVGDPVASAAYGAFAQYQLLNEKQVFKVPILAREVVPLLASALTASISLAEIGQLKPSETVLVTAAAGGTGQFAVQLAKLAGCHVIGTCSSQDKVEMLKNLGCDRVINYKQESLDQVLQKEYPKGINVVYESVGGEFFDICTRHLAVQGRLIIIGFIAGYRDETGWVQESSSSPRSKIPIPAQLLPKSASIHGFLLNHYTNQWSSFNSSFCCNPYLTM